MQYKPTADISIIAANYNNGQYMEAFIQSITESTMHPSELIIVDDGSTDKSLEILRRFSELPFLKVVSFKTNKGFTTALNTALEAATGKYVMRADPDDILQPERIEKQWLFLEQNPEVDIVGSNITYFDNSTGKLLNRSNFPSSPTDIIRRYQRGEHGLLHATVCGKRSVYQQYRYQKLAPGEDYELFARMVKDGRNLANISAPLYLVRVHPTSSTTLLKFEAIARTFMFRDQIFGTKTSKFKVFTYYWHIRHYRKYQISSSMIASIYHLLFSILFHPRKLINRVFR